MTPPQKEKKKTHKPTQIPLTRDTYVQNVIDTQAKFKQLPSRMTTQAF